MDSEIRVMLADTDAVSLTKLKNYIKLTGGARPRIVCAVVSDGDFLAAARKHNPRLIMADIRFFGAAAAKTLGVLTAERPDTRLIIYGGYDDADYIRNVTRFGVIDYMYKPVRQTDVARAMRSAAAAFDRIDEERENDRAALDAYGADLPLMRDRFIHSLLCGVITDEAEAARGLEYFGVSIGPPYQVAIAKIDRFRDFIAGLDARGKTEKDKHMPLFRLCRLARELLGEQGLVYAIGFHEAAIIFGGADDFTRELREGARRVTGLSVTIGVGRPRERLSQIAGSFREAETALLYRHIVGAGSVITIDEAEPGNISCARADKERSLILAAAVGDGAYARRLLSEWLAELESRGELPDNLINKIVMNIVIAINREATERGVNVSADFTRVFPTQGIFEIKTARGAFEYLDAHIEEFCEYVRDSRAKVKPGGR